MKKKIYFYLQPFVSWTNKKSNYQHAMICLIEGLIELGHNCYSNVNYWPKDASLSSFLIYNDKHVHPKDCDVVIISSMYYANNIIPHEIKKLYGKLPIVLEESFDGYFSPSYSKNLDFADLILKIHYNKRYPENTKIVPWTFGITNRFLSFIPSKPFEEKENCILWNFRINHQLRQKALLEIQPRIANYYRIDNTIDEKESYIQQDGLNTMYWEHSGQRHSLDYFEKLASYKIVACFGGGLIGRFKSNNLINKLIRKVEAPFAAKNYNTIFQWDSYRFWETLVAGSVPLMYELESLGAVFPVAGQSGVHYCGIDFKNGYKNIGSCLNDESLKNISIKGREWAISNYAPQPTAKRLLEHLSTRFSV